MGRNKLLLPLGDRTILARVVDVVLTLLPSKVVVVVRPQTADTIAKALAGRPVAIIENADADRGMGTSIARAAEFFAGEHQSLLLLQGDQPFVSATALLDLGTKFEAEPAAFVASRYGTLVTTPVLFSAALSSELRMLGGDRGARDVLRRHWNDGTIVDLPEWMGLDVDDEEAYRRACDLWVATSR